MKRRAGNVKRIPRSVKRSMIAEAKNLEPNLTKASGSKSLRRSFTIEPKLRLVIFWYNLPSGTTRTIMRKTEAISA